MTDRKAELELEASVEALLETTGAGREAARSPLWTYPLGAGLLALLGLGDFLLFRELASVSYLAWYLDNGALIGFATSIVTTTWGDLNRNTGLISAHPLRYLAACFHLVGLSFFSLGTHLRRSDDPTKPRSPLNLFLTLPCALAVFALLFMWIIVVTPLQYLVYLLAGAPARLTLQSEWRPIAYVRANNHLRCEEYPKADEIPKGWWDASLFEKPVSTTALFAAMILFALDLIV